MGTWAFTIALIIGISLVLGCWSLVLSAMSLAVSAARDDSACAAIILFHLIMRYLVKARIKTGYEKSLLRAIEQWTLGKGSIAGDEYRHDMEKARVDAAGTASWVETCFCDPPLAEERPYWEKFFQPPECERRPHSPVLPARERHRSMGLLRLRLHEAA